MEKVYEHKEIENKVYEDWENSGYFRPEINNGDPFVIIMPPPNANGFIHIGHARGNVIQDLMVRFERMRGKKAFILPGADHAGIQTQVVYERELAKRDLNRYKLGREEFFRQVYDFSIHNRDNMENQIRHLGISCDWSRKKFTLEPDVTKVVYQTFVEMYEDELIYKGERLINWCFRCSTALSDLEVEHEDKTDSLYFVRYEVVEPEKDEPKYLVVATVRPEPIMIDTHLAINPKDKLRKKWIGRKVKNPITDKEMEIIADEFVDVKFGTGIVKLTPGHDKNDYEAATKHGLPVVSVIGQDGRLNNNGGKYSGLKISEARNEIVKDLNARGLIEKIDEKYTHSVGVCERCKSIVEQLISTQWFVAVNKPGKKSGKVFAADAIKAVSEGKIKFIQDRQEKIFKHWMNNIHDWCISRQIWWGHQIPVWYCQDCNDQTPIVAIETPKVCERCQSKNIFQDPDTLDTWFSSGQWPYSTLGYPDSKDYKSFYPTSVMETAYDIIFFWVARMIMFGIYKTDQPPFTEVYFHGLVRDDKGQKMSKSKGNVISPIEVAEQYGADAVRMSLIYGSNADNDLNLGMDKIRGMRNFTNKIWNASRFVIDFYDGQNHSDGKRPKMEEFNKELLEKIEGLHTEITKNYERRNFTAIANELYEFFWHYFCDEYLEKAKSDREKYQPTLEYTLGRLLKLLHPITPFITEEIWGKLPYSRSKIIIEPWQNEI